jgi:hypothetical protein
LFYFIGLLRGIGSLFDLLLWADPEGALGSVPLLLEKKNNIKSKPYLEELNNR